MTLERAVPGPPFFVPSCDAVGPAGTGDPQGPAQRSQGFRITVGASVVNGIVLQGFWCAPHVHRACTRRTPRVHQAGTPISIKTAFDQVCEESVNMLIRPFATSDTSRAVAYPRGGQAMARRLRLDSGLVALRQRQPSPAKLSFAYSTFRASITTKACAQGWSSVSETWMIASWPGGVISARRAAAQPVTAITG